MPNNKKQRGREEKKKRIKAQQEAKKVAKEQQAQRMAEEARVHLQGLFGTPAIDELITDIGRLSLSTAAAASKPSSCYHGSSAERFVAGSTYLKMVQSFVSLYKKYPDPNERYDVEKKFYIDKANRKIIIEGDFTNFVFAVAVALYSKSSLEERERYYTVTTTEQQKSTAMYELQIVITMGLNIKYSVVPYLDNTLSQQARLDSREKVGKYSRDVNTERGLRKCLHRDTKQYCDCMATKNIEAKGMEKMERCERCHQEFTKKLMKKCDGCETVVYCGEKCQIQDWPRHQIACQREKKYLAAITMDNTVFIDSQHLSEGES